jgi:hypothetical protein
MSIKFEHIKVYSLKWGALKRRAAITIPGIGIFVHPIDKNNKDLLRHEFGHILQHRTWGLWFFYTHIAIQSVKSARKANKDKKFNHMSTWTEYTANILAYQYFNKPIDWNFRDYPIIPPTPINLNSKIPSKILDYIQ